MPTSDLVDAITDSDLPDELARFVGDHIDLLLEVN